MRCFATTACARRPSTFAAMPARCLGRRRSPRPGFSVTGSAAIPVGRREPRSVGRNAESTPAVAAHVTGPLPRGLAANSDASITTSRDRPLSKSNDILSRDRVTEGGERRKRNRASPACRDETPQHFTRADLLLCTLGLGALIAPRAGDYIARCRHIARRFFREGSSITQTII